MRAHAPALSLAAALLLTACTNDPAGTGADQAADAVVTFTRLADSVRAAGGDVDVADAYGHLAGTVRGNSQISPVTISIDGVPAEFLATVRQSEMDAGPTCSQPGSLCLLVPPVRTLIAWQKSDPRRVVQVRASAGTTNIGSYVAGTAVAAFRGTAMLTYFDGPGAVYVGTEGTQAISDPAPGATPCPETPLPPGAAPSSTLETFRCTRTSYTASFSGVVKAPSFPLGGNAPAGTHTLAMPSVAVLGTRIVASLPPCGLCGTNGFFDPPPIDFGGSFLPATLTAAVTDVVTLTFAVTNPRNVPMTVSFNDGQEFDLVVRRLSDGAPVWRWSQNKGFTQALKTRTLAPGETVTYSDSWTPTTTGEFSAQAILASVSHRASALTFFDVR